MRHQPAGVGGITVKAETQLIIDTAQAHLGQGFFNHCQRLLIAGVVIASEQEIQLRGGGKFRRFSKPAIVRVIGLHKKLTGLIQYILIEFCSRLTAAQANNMLGDLVCAGQNLLAIISPRCGYFRQQFHHSGPSPALVLGKIGAGIKGFFIRGHDDGHGPAAAAG